MECLLEIVGLEAMTALLHIRRAEGREFQIVGAATLKLQASSGEDMVIA